MGRFNAQETVVVHKTDHLRDVVKKVRICSFERLKYRGAVFKMVRLRGEGVKRTGHVLAVNPYNIVFQRVFLCRAMDEYMEEGSRIILGTPGCS